MLLRRLSLGFTTMLLVFLCTAGLAARQSNGKVTGVVRDPTGIAVPGVTVTATNQATNAAQTATTGADGSYSLSVPPGAYTIAVSLPGFRRITRAAEVASGGTNQLDFALEAL